jgi:hypothetical protein
VSRPGIYAIQPTPALEFELLHSLRRGRATLAAVFGRKPDVGWGQPAPTWAVVVANGLVGSGLLAWHPTHDGLLLITPAGWRCLGVAAPNGGPA